MQAAEAMRPQLAALTESPERYAAFERRLVVPPEKLPEKLDFVTIEGTRYANPEVLEDQMQTRPDEPFKLSTLESDLARLYGRGEFEQIDYQLVTVGKQTGVVVTVVEKSWGPNFLRFGTSLSTDLQGETFFNLMLGHKRVWLNSLGLEWRNEVDPGQHAALRDRALSAADDRQQPLRRRPTVPCSARRSSFSMATAASPSTTC